MSKEIVIIGGGFGGLFTAALLAKEGFHVTVLEKERQVGGGLRSFSRQGVSFDTGMHVLGGMHPNSALYKICRYLGILDQLSFRANDVDCTDEIYCHEDRKIYRVPSHRANFTAYFQQMFPEEKEAIQRYVDELFRMSEEVDFFFLKEGVDWGKSYGDAFFRSSKEFINSHISDPKLQNLLAYMSPLCGGESGYTPAYIFALINYLFIEEHSRFEGPASQLAEALQTSIESHGGTIVTGAHVTHVAVEDNLVRQVTTADGRVFRGDVYISDIHPQSLLNISDNQLFTKAFRARVNESPNNYSAYCVYMVFKPDTFPYINYPCYYMDSYDSVWNFGKHIEEDWPQTMVAFTPCEKHQGPYAKAMEAIVFMPYSACACWENTVTGHRGEDYLEWKREHTARILEKLENRYPGIRECVAHVYDASPLTIRDYNGAPEGSLYGLMKDCRNPYAGYVPVRTKTANLLLTGQNIYLHGCCGVPLTAVITAEALLGDDVLVRKINRGC